MVNTGTDLITLSTTSYDALKTGDKVRYAEDAGSAGGQLDALTTNTDYYVVKGASPAIKLATTAANAAAATGIDLTDTVIVATFDGAQNAAVVDVAADTIALTTAQYDALTTGDAITYSKGIGGTVVDGLSDATVYYAIKLGTPKIQVATSNANAVAGTPVFVDLTTFASAAGSAHTFSRSFTAGTAHTLTAQFGETMVQFDGSDYPNVVVIGADTVALRPIDYNLLTTGDKVLYSAGAGGTAVDGLTASTEYFVVKDTRLELRTPLRLSSARRWFSSTVPTTPTS